jgi:hypothetical protein
MHSYIGDSLKEEKEKLGDIKPIQHGGLKYWNYVSDMVKKKMH